MDIFNTSVVIIVPFNTDEKNADENIKMTKESKDMLNILIKSIVKMCDKLPAYQPYYTRYIFVPENTKAIDYGEMLAENVGGIVVKNSLLGDLSNINKAHEAFRSIINDNPPSIGVSIILAQQSGAHQLALELMESLGEDTITIPKISEQQYYVAELTIDNPQIKVEKALI